MTKPYDWIIRGGRVIDPSNGIDASRDVAISAGRIAEVKEALDPLLAGAVFDARGLLVTPGLVDLHIHGYNRVTPLGIDVDHYCLGRGVTTAVDAGSAGCCTWPGFRAFAVDTSKTRLVAFLHISSAGLAFAGLGGDRSVPGELDLLKLADVEGCIECVEANRDRIVGVKIRLSDSIADDGRHEAEAYRRSLEAARALNLPLMVHHAFSTVPLGDCPGKMASGDIYTHCYHGFPSTIVDPESRKVGATVRLARERGVLFDVGHGQGSFNWTVGELCAQEAFWPDTISTDLHSGTCEGPAYDLPTVMTRLLHLGMPLNDVVRCTTVAPAKAIGWEERIGTLGVGREADVAVFALEDVDLELEDCQSQMRRIRRLLTPQAVWRAGTPYPITHPIARPNPKTLAAQSKAWIRLEIRDAVAPMIG
ncbi:MAG: amidohydrolase family protein [Acidimicrobiia bacterium]|nr:amidohydrolase family protein [Acidimicrobiia bacterium]